MELAVSVKVTVSANHDGADTTGYQLFVDEVAVETKPVSALVNGVISFEYSAEVGATHSYAIEAYRDPEMSDSKTVTIS